MDIRKRIGSCVFYIILLNLNKHPTNPLYSKLYLFVLAIIMKKSIYFRTFAKVALIPYVGGTIIHILRLLYKFPIKEAPSIVHWVIVLFGGYACLGFVLYIHRIPFKSLMDKVLYGLVIFHLGGSVVMHGYSLIAQTNSWMGVFSMHYSYFAVFYFVCLGLYCNSLSKRIDNLSVINKL